MWWKRERKFELFILGRKEDGSLDEATCNEEELSNCRHSSGRRPSSRPGTSQAEPRTTLRSPFDPLVYDRERTVEMYKPEEERKFGHVVLPILHDHRLIRRIVADRNRKTNELVVRRLHWEEGTPNGATPAAVDEAIAQLAAFVKCG